VPQDPAQLAIAASMPGAPTGSLEERMAVIERSSRNGLALPRLEAWRAVGGVGQPAFEGSWSNVGGAYFPVAFYKDPGDVVRIRGVARWTGAPAGSVVFTLPAGYRPTQQMVFPIYMTYTGPATIPPETQYCVISAAGTVTPTIDGRYNTVGMTDWRAFLDPIQFRTT
jgi:hypothetical protein